MAVSESYREFVLEQLKRIQSVTWRKMFGGVGIYSGDAFFALLDNDTLFFKVDDQTRPDYESRGSKPFQPFGSGSPPMRGYFELPADILEDPDLLGIWMHRSMNIASRPKASKKPRAKHSNSKTRPL